MNDILFSLILFICSLLMIFISKFIMYKLFKCQSYKKNLCFSTTILTIISFVLYVLLTYIVSKGNGFELETNLSSFSLVYLISLVISVVINCICEHNLYSNKKYVYTKNKKSKKKS